MTGAPGSPPGPTGPDRTGGTAPASGPQDAAGWDARYAGHDLLWSAEPNRFLVEEVGALAAGEALDAACGEGRNAVWLAERGWRVTGVDFSPVALAKARRMAAHRGVSVDWVEADLLEWEPPRPFDLVVVLYLHLPAPLRRRVLRRMARDVAPGGTLLVVAHDRSNLTEGHGGPQDPALLYGPGDVASDVGDLLRVARAETVRRPVEAPDGPVEAIDLLVRAVRAGAGHGARRPA